MCFYEQILAKSKVHKVSFNKLNEKLDKYLDKYQKIINRYFEFVVLHEGYSPFVYLDKPGGYPTIGYGHQLYFQRKGSAAAALISNLERKISNKFPTSLNYPQEIMNYLSLTNEEILSIYKGCRCMLGIARCNIFSF